MEIVDGPGALPSWDSHTLPSPADPGQSLIGPVRALTGEKATSSKSGAPVHLSPRGSNVEGAGKGERPPSLRETCSPETT